MDSSKFSIKFFVQNSATVGPITDLVPVFHSWIQTHALADHLLIDVADYAHVHDGPGIVLVSHEANYSFDSNKSRPGLTYQRKQPLEGSFARRVRDVLRYALEAAVLLEEPFQDRIQFRADEIQFRIHDRLLAPNTSETFSAVKDELRNACAELYDSEKVQLVHSSADRPAELFEVTVRAAEPASTLRLQSLLDQLKVGR